MKTKLLVATEKESSDTIRITPEDIGVLLSKCNKGQLYLAMGAAVRNSTLYGTDKQRRDMVEVLLSSGKSFQLTLDAEQDKKPARKMKEYDLWFKPCSKCGYNIGRMSESSERKCWKCGSHNLERDYSDKTLKINRMF